MKIIITENQADKFLRKYINKLVEYPEFEWVDKIDMNKTTTKSGGWSREYVKPLYQYIVYIKSGYSVKGSDKDKIINEISRIHSMLFIPTDSGPEYYFGVDFIP
jgi:hypothetical protein